MNRKYVRHFIFHVLLVKVPGRVQTWQVADGYIQGNGPEIGDRIRIKRPLSTFARAC
jgi:hypothetical protein